MYYVLQFLCMMDYDNNKFIHAPTFTYYEVMQLLIGVVECQYCTSVVFNYMDENVNKSHVWMVIINVNNFLKR